MPTRLEQLLEDDVSSLDLTTHWLDIGDSPARLAYTTRQAGVVSGLREVRALCAHLGAEVLWAGTDGSAVSPGTRVLEAAGSAESLHRLWKTGLNLLEFCSGVATRTRSLVDAAAAIQPACGIFATRKMVPGSGPWALRAVLDGGGMPHRMGLAETVLIFEQHRAFFGDAEAVAGFIRAQRHRVLEKKVIVEVTSLEEAALFAKAGVDGLQFDKVPPKILSPWVRALRDKGFGGVLIAAGGVTSDNIAAYAATGVNGVATSWIYHGPGLDLGTTIEAA